jgi:hypothetical protein
MKILQYFFCISIMLFYFVNIAAQEINCDKKYIDTSKCFHNLKFKKSPIILEKKWESTEITETEQVPLIADMDGDCIPEIFVSGINTFDDKTIDTFRLHFFDGKNGNLKHKFDCLDYGAANFTPLIVDTDNDGTKEIIYSSYSGTPLPAGLILCYEYSGKLKWMSDKYFYNSTYNPGGPNFGAADFNQDGKTEIYCNNRIFNGQTGVMLAEGGLNGVGSNYTFGILTHQVSIAAQLDDDPNDLELAAGYSIYKIKINNPNGSIGNTMIPINFQVEGKYLDGKTAVADINRDGRLDVIVAHCDYDTASRLYIYTLDKGVPKLLAKNFIPSIHNANGSPSIADIDGNGIPNILVSKLNLINNFEYDGTNALKLIWSFRIVDNFAYNGVSTFDFNGDGIQEIIYRDLKYLYIIDGSVSPPQIISSINCRSGTLHEYPIIADIDNTGEAKICTICRTMGDTVGFGRITIFGGPDSLPWAPARSVWNQYAYNPLQINDDLTVPRYQKNQATYLNGKYNNFYQQESLLDSNGMYKVPAASLTGAIQCINYDLLTDEYLVIFDVYNRKDASAIADTNLAISFYNGDPTNSAALLGIYYSNKKIYRGDSLRDLEFRFSAKNIKDVFMVVNTVRNNSGNFNDGDFIQKECDYTDNISRTIDLPKIDTIHAAICKGNQFVFQDTIYTESGEYIQKLNNSKGCDSIYFRIFITATDSVFVNQKIATCDAFVWNGKSISQSGIYQYDTLNHFGCDSITTLDLTIHKSTQSNSKQTACNRYTWNGTEYTQSGIYQYKTTNAVACDSIAILDLQIHFSDTFVQKISTCNPYTWNGRTLTQSGIYQFDTINQFTCDSIVILELQITALIQSRENHSACDQYFWNGKVYTNSGTYDYVTKNALGCDSMITLDLMINRSDSVFTSQTSCAAIDWNGKNYTQSGRYFHETKNIKGCDSVTTLDLTIIPPKENFINKDICDSITILGRKIDRAGRYDFRLTDVNGCDSIIHYDIAIRTNPSSIKLSVCDSLRWNVNGKVYTNSTLITEKFNNQYGCDSSITLDLHIAKSKQIFLEASACKEYFWSETQKILTQSGDYLHLLQTAEQCDSTIHLRLTIHSEYSDIDTIISNKEYTWPVNQITYDSSGNYFIKFISKDQCDSIHYLLLTIIKENNIFYPNVIHPNSQIKQNTAFTIFDNGAIKSIERLRIYDRWGELIWQRENFPSNDVNNGWDGTFRDKAVNPGIFVWVADLLLTDGRRVVEKGDVTVVR